MGDKWYRRKAAQTAALSLPPFITITLRGGDQLGDHTLDVINVRKGPPSVELTEANLNCIAAMVTHQYMGGDIHNAKRKRLHEDAAQNCDVEDQIDGEDETGEPAKCQNGDDDAAGRPAETATPRNDLMALLLRNAAKK